MAIIEETLANQKKGKSAKPVSVAPPMELIGESAIMQELFYKIKKIAPTDANILILGENGTGKDLIAAAIHTQSMRAEKPYVKVDVGSLTDTLFESELFGHKKGAFTDARDDREGRFEAANAGTLFLDEIGNIPLRQQAKLLTALQNRQVVPLGSNSPVPVDIRLLCATNVPLETLADESRFRRDLIYRINTVELQVPPLRARGEDIVLIANHFLKKYAAKYLKPEVKLGEAACQKLLTYHYPGNVRELQYSMERAVIMAEQELLTPADIIFSPIENKPGSAPAEVAEAAHNLGELERATIRNVVDKHNGNITKAARELGITRAALYRRLNKYDI
nr:sigma-54 dependent transcriptional regulator [Parapedobacter lycopersici]